MVTTTDRETATNPVGPREGELTEHGRKEREDRMHGSPKGMSGRLRRKKNSAGEEGATGSVAGGVEVAVDDSGDPGTRPSART